MATTVLSREGIKHRVRTRLMEGPLHAELERLSAPERRLRVRAEVMALLKEERAILPSGALTEVVNQVSDEVVGLGPVERLLKDPDVSEVMVNGADDVYVERKGRIERVDDLFLGLTYLAHQAYSRKRCLVIIRASLSPSLIRPRSPLTPVQLEGSPSRRIEGMEAPRVSGSGKRSPPKGASDKWQRRHQLFRQTMLARSISV